jgi:hypothetical protein
MNKNNKKIEEVIIILTIVAFLSLSMLVFEKTKNVSFGEITGQVITTANISALRISYCNFTLESGLNLVSFFCIPNGAERDAVIGNFSNMEAIFEYVENSLDSWKTYNPNLPDFVIQDLKTMNRNKGYWVKMSFPENIAIQGGLRLPTIVNLVRGWNLIGYPTNATKSVNQSFSSITSNLTEARTYITNTGVFISYKPGIGGGLIQTEPYKGYWINFTTTGVWTVD